MEPLSMNLKILLPYQVFADVKGIKRIVAESFRGSFGLLPHRLDCTAALAPGILIYETGEGKEVFLAIDEGILVKAGPDVFVSVRNAFEGTELGSLYKAVKQEFKNIDEHEKNVRSVMAKLEIGFIRRFEEFRKK
jgi:F-type H+-transporting ATPase subunit epsilon